MDALIPHLKKRLKDTEFDLHRTETISAGVLKSHSFQITKNATQPDNSDCISSISLSTLNGYHIKNQKDQRMTNKEEREVGNRVALTNVPALRYLSASQLCQKISQNKIHITSWLQLQNGQYCDLSM